MTQSKRRYNLIIIMTIVALFLATLIVVSSTLAWLQYRKDKSGTVIIGGIKLQTYYNGTEVDTTSQSVITVQLGAVNTAKLVDLKLRNTGSISCLVRANISISATPASAGGTTTAISSLQANIANPSWINAFASMDITPTISATGYAGEMYLNVVLNPYSYEQQEVSVLDSITPIINNLANSNVYVFVSFEAIPYDGNPYKTGEGNMPWVEPPSAWTAYR